MAESIHSKQTNNHPPFNWYWSSATVRDAETLDTDDLNKLGITEDDDAIWRLDDLTPTWVQVGGSPTAAITVGTEATNVINVSVQLTDPAGDNLTGVHVLKAHLSDTSGGAVSATAPSGGIAIGTNGVIMEETTADLSFWIATNSSGVVDIDITEASVDTWYLVIYLPDGTIANSTAITFA